MTKIALSRIIAAPPAQVFVFFVPQRMPYWYGREMESCFEMQEGAADFVAGSKVRISGHVGKKLFSHTAVVTTFQYGRLLEWRFHDAYGVRGRERWELEPAGAASGASRSRTQVRFVSDYEFPGLFGRALDWLLTRHAVERRHREYLDRLARLAERRP